MSVATPVVPPRLSSRLHARVVAVAATSAGALIALTAPGACAVAMPASSTSIQVSTATLAGTGSPGAGLVEGISGARARLEGYQGTAVDEATLCLRIVDLQQRIIRARTALAGAKASNAPTSEIISAQIGLARLEDQELLAQIQLANVGTHSSAG